MGMDFQQIESRTKVKEQRWVRLHLGYSAQAGPLCEVLGIPTRQGKWFGENRHSFL